jgi:hypothetical protein
MKLELKLAYIKAELGVELNHLEPKRDTLIYGNTMMGNWKCLKRVPTGTKSREWYAYSRPGEWHNEVL